MKITTKQISSLEKVFLNSDGNFKEISRASALKGEKYSYQITATKDSTGWATLDLKYYTESPLSEYIKIYKVENIPGELTHYKKEFGGSDDYYLTKAPGLFPDLLSEGSNVLKLKECLWKTLWIEINLPKDIEAGEYPVKIFLENENENIKIENTFTLKVINAVLPEKEFIYSNWFHADCLYTYYNVEPLSDRHFEIIYEFMKTANEYGMNTVLTPIFTPPLDVDVGGERPTIQLVDITCENGKYSFDFKNLKRYVDTAHNAGITGFEIAHFFTQWGAAATPKIIVNGEKKFGWHISSKDPLYEEFLSQFVPALRDFFEKENIIDNIFFHVSDEPVMEHMENYTAAKNIIKKYSGNVKFIDAISHLEVFKTGAVETPIVAIENIDEFIKDGVSPLMAYNCCAQTVDVSNRFFDMPSERNRIIGTQLYKFNISGFLHWGYNFYYSERSREFINPYLTTDAGGSFPSGDAFIVYPGADGKPVKSLRLIVLNEAFQDARAFALAEKCAGRDAVMKLIDSEGDITFRNYPRRREFITDLREKINNLIENSR